MYWPDPFAALPFFFLAIRLDPVFDLAFDQDNSSSDDPVRQPILLNPTLEGADRDAGIEAELLEGLGRGHL